MITCHSEEFIPIPTPTNKPYFDIRVKVAAACKAAELLLNEGYDGEGKELDEGIKDDANGVVKDMVLGNAPPLQQLNNTISTPAGALLVHSILKQYDTEILEETKRMRNYITNRLIVESDHPDPRIRLDALKTLGKIGGVDLFIEKRELTIQNRSTLDLETTLRDKLQRIMGTVGAEEAVIRSEVVAARPEVSAKSELEGLKELFRG